jgi:hypothetical protein
MSLCDPLSAFLGAPVRRRLTKVAGSRIADDRGPLGDVDVLGVDYARRIVWSVECKTLAPSRTPIEVFNELADLLGADNRTGHLARHIRVVEWLRDHRAELLTEVGVVGDDWKIEGLFVVDDDLFGPYFRETPVPVVPLRRLREFVLSTMPKQPDRRPKGPTRRSRAATRARSSRPQRRGVP